MPLLKETPIWVWLTACARLVAFPFQGERFPTLHTDSDEAVLLQGFEMSGISDTCASILVQKWSHTAAAIADDVLCERRMRKRWGAWSADCITTLMKTATTAILARSAGAARPRIVRVMISGGCRGDSYLGNDQIEEGFNN